MPSAAHHHRLLPITIGAGAALPRHCPGQEAAGGAAVRRRHAACARCAGGAQPCLRLCAWAALHADSAGPYTLPHTAGFTVVLLHPCRPAALSLATRMGANAQQKGEVGRCLAVLITGRLGAARCQQQLQLAAMHRSSCRGTHTTRPPHPFCCGCRRARQRQPGVQQPRAWAVWAGRRNAAAGGVGPCPVWPCARWRLPGGGCLPLLRLLHDRSNPCGACC